MKYNRETQLPNHVKSTITATSSNMNQQNSLKNTVERDDNDSLVVCQRVHVTPVETLTFSSCSSPSFGAKDTEQVNNFELDI